MIKRRIKLANVACNGMWRDFSSNGSDLNALGKIAMFPVWIVFVAVWWTSTFLFVRE